MLTHIPHERISDVTCIFFATKSWRAAFTVHVFARLRMKFAAICHVHEHKECVSKCACVNNDINNNNDNEEDDDDDNNNNNITTTLSTLSTLFQKLGASMESRHCGQDKRI